MKTDVEEIATIRPMRKEDEGFIFSTWALGLRHGNEIFATIDEPTYFEKYFDIIGRIVSQSSVRVAALKEDPDVVLGYSVNQGQKLHFVFVKEAWRKLGIATALTHPFEEFTHYTRLGLAIQIEKYPNAKFNPFI